MQIVGLEAHPLQLESLQGMQAWLTTEKPAEQEVHSDGPLVQLRQLESLHGRTHVPLKIVFPETQDWQ